MTANSPKKRLPLFPRRRFDQVALSVILFLGVILAILVWHGDQTRLRVTRFSWQGEKVGVQDKILTLNFNRPVDQDSVESNFVINPPLLGRKSWQGNNFVYTLSETPTYGSNYQVKLEKAVRTDLQEEIEPFVNLFSTRDRILAYVGVGSEERGRLILYNITNPKQPKKTILTPKDLVISQFKIAPDGKKIFFLAFDPRLGSTSKQLFTVTTGIKHSLADPEITPGKLKRVLDNKDYNNLSFDLSKDGQTLIVLRSNRQNKADSGLWILQDGSTPRPLGVPAKDFIISPDGTKIAVSSQGGVGLIPLTTGAGASRLLNGYSKALAFSKDGKRLLLTKENADYTRSLILMESDGRTQEILRNMYPILDCQFEPKQEKVLYCLRTDVVKRDDGDYHEEPFLSAVQLDTWQDQPLLALPNYRDVQISMSPDGTSLLFDQVATTAPLSSSDLLTPSNQAIADARVWLLALPDSKSVAPTQSVMPKEVTAGFYPKWMP